MDRPAEINAFLANAGWDTAHSANLASDASARKYLRLDRNGTTAVLMDAPKGTDGGTPQFVKTANYLSSLGLNAPTILAQDADNGLLLLEDFGDRIFAHEITRDPSFEMPLYRRAVEVLTTLSNTPPMPDLTSFDPNTAANICDLAFDYYQYGATGQTSQTAKEATLAELETALLAVSSPHQTTALRDYHAENLVFCPNESGIKQAGLLDFQDAVTAHPIYDLVSLLSDVRRDVSDSVKHAMIHQFAESSPLSLSEVQSAYAVWSLQRNLRILGIFARLSMRDGKPQYVDMIPRVWRHIQTALTAPELSNLRTLITKTLPAPTTDILNRLRAQ